MDAKRADALIGAEVAKRRQELGLTQARVATLLGVEHAQVISAIEKGERAVKAMELARLGKILQVSPLELLRPLPIPERPFVLWRELKNKGAARPNEEAFLLRCRRYAFVEDLCRVARQPLDLGLRLDLGHTSYEKVGRWAEETRRRLGLGDAPATALYSVLENHFGVKIFMSSLAAGSGACTLGEFGSAVLLNLLESRERRAFSLAHELFHLLTWDAIKPMQGQLESSMHNRNEQLAHVFASSLLLPAEPLLSRFEDQHQKACRYFDLVEIASHFGVSVPALIWRLVNLRFFDRKAAENLLLETAPVATQPQKHDPAATLPRRFVTLALGAYVDGKISIGKLAELLETTVGLLPRVLAEYELNLDLNVYQTEVIPAGRRRRHRAS